MYVHTVEVRHLDGGQGLSLFSSDVDVLLRRLNLALRALLSQFSLGCGEPKATCRRQADLLT